MAAIDTSLDREIKWDRGLLALSLLGALFLFALGVWASGQSFSQWISGFPAPFAGWALIMIASYLAFGVSTKSLGQQPALLISREGVRDLNLSEDTISWSSIARVEEKRVGLTCLIVLVAKPGEKGKLRMSFLQRLHQIGNPKNAWYISAGFTQVSHAGLLRILKAYFDAYGSTPTPRRSGKGYI